MDAYRSVNITCISNECDESSDNPKFSFVCVFAYDTFSSLTVRVNVSYHYGIHSLDAYTHILIIYLLLFLLYLYVCVCAEIMHIIYKIVYSYNI